MNSGFSLPRWLLLALALGVTAPMAFAQATTVTTHTADQFTTNTARLRGLVNPNGFPTVAWFEWGTTTNYGNVTSNQDMGTDVGVVPALEVITNLTGGTVYHFRFVGSNEFGAVAGLDSSFALTSFAQTPTLLTSINDSSVAWGDYDNDGQVDFLVTGQRGYGEPTGITSNLWRNTGSGFTNVPISGMPATLNGAVAWADYDNDGRLDFLLTGGGTSQLRRNTGTTFTNVPIAGLSGAFFTAVAWGDYDNDGRLDFLLAGDSMAITSVQLWRNTGGAFTNVTASVAPGLPDIGSGSLAWGDYDNDGWLDFLLTGSGFSQLWRNRGGTFTNVLIAGLPGVAQSSAAWADYDNDGRLDFLLTGSGVSQLWRNTGTTFTNVPIAGLPGVTFSSVAWADYDNDGRQDFLLTGSPGGTSASSQLWRNTGNGFVNVPIPGLAEVQYGSVAWADYDNDGRLDFILSGTLAPIPNLTGAFQLWRNIHPASNSPPTVPTGLFVVPVGAQARLTWTAASDVQTPAAALSYNLRVGTSPGASDVVPPRALANGCRLGPGFGNVGSGTNRLVPVEFGVTYYWSVQTVDNGFAASAFAPEQSFTMNSVLTPPGGVPVPGDQNGDGVVNQSELSAVLMNLNGTGIVSESDLQLVLANYFPNSPWLQLTNVAGLGGTEVTFALTNSLAGAFSVECTTNFADWYFLGPATSRYLFTDTNAPAVPERYYRLRWP